MDADQSLDIKIKFGVEGQDNAEAAKKIIQDTAPAVTNLTQKTREANDVSKEENISLREKHEIIRGLTQAFPGLAEAVIFALNPATLAAFAIGGAFEIFKQRVEAADEALDDVKMPDLTGPIDDAKNLAVAWDGIKEAVDGAIRKFNSADATFDRDKKGLDAQTDAAKKNLDAQKQKALADLEAQKGSMDEATYNARKQDIENAFGNKQNKNEEDAKKAALAAEYREKANAEIAAKAAQQKADAIKLPSDDKQVDTDQKQLQAAADNFKATAAKARENAQKVQQTQADLSDPNWIEKLKGVGGAVDFGKEYGGGMTGGDAINFENARARDADAKAVAIEKTIAATQKQLEQRKRLREEAAKSVGLAAGLGAQLPIDRAAADAESDANKKSGAELNAAGAEKAASDFLNNNNATAQTTAQLKAHIAENQALQAELKQSINDLVTTHQGGWQIIVQMVAQLQKQLNDSMARLNQPQGQ